MSGFAQCDKIQQKINAGTQAITYQTPNDKPLFATKICAADTTYYLQLLAPAIETADRTGITIWLESGEQLIWTDEAVRIVADQRKLFPGSSYVARSVITLSEGIMSRLRHYRITSYKLSTFGYSVPATLGEQLYQQLTCLLTLGEQGK